MQVTFSCVIIDCHYKARLRFLVLLSTIYCKIAYVFLVRMQLTGVGEQGIRNDTAYEHQSTGCPQAAL